MLTRSRRAGVSQETIQLIWRTTAESEDYAMGDPSETQQRDHVETSGSEDVWEDIEMPVNEEFRYALRDASQLLRYVNMSS